MAETAAVIDDRSSHHLSSQGKGIFYSFPGNRTQPSYTYPGPLARTLRPPPLLSKCRIAVQTRTVCKEKMCKKVIRTKRESIVGVG